MWVHWQRKRVKLGPRLVVVVKFLLARLAHSLIGLLAFLGSFLCCLFGGLGHLDAEDSLHVVWEAFDERALGV